MSKTDVDLALREEDPLLAARAQLLKRLRVLQARFERNGVLFFLALSLLLAIWAFLGSRTKPFWYDELLGLCAATAPHLSDVWRVLASGVDFNPPLYHYLTRFSIEIFGLSTFGARLPAFVEMWVFLLCLFVFVSRRMNLGYGALSTGLILCMPIRGFAWEARPYALVLCITGIALVAWQQYHLAIDRKLKSFTLIVFALACGALPATHYYAFLIALVFAGSEIVNAWSGSKIQWRLLAASVVPPCAVIFFLRHIIVDQKSQMSHYHTVGSAGSFIAGYEVFAINAWAIVLLILALALGFWLDRGQDVEKPQTHTSNFTSRELILAGLLSALPLIGTASTLVLHAYAPRYFIAASAGIVILSCYLLASLTPRCSTALLLVSLAAGCYLCHEFASFAKRPQLIPPLADLRSPQLNGKAIVFEDAKDYLQSVLLNPERKDEFYYVAEPDLAVKVSGSDSDDRIMIAMAKWQALQVIDFDALAARHTEIFVVPASFGWLDACLLKMKLDMRLEDIELSHARTFQVLRTELPQKGSSWCEAPTRSTPASALD